MKRWRSGVCACLCAMTIPVVARAASPVWDAVPAKTVLVGHSTPIAVHATDADGDPLVISAGPGNPSFVTVADDGGGNGTVTALAAYGDAGNHTIHVLASDGVNAPVDLAFTIAVNRQPILVVPAHPTLLVGIPACLSITTGDPDGDPVTFSLGGLSSFAGTASFDPPTSTGLVSVVITPSAADLGDHVLTPHVDDGRGGVTEGPFTAQVIANVNDAGGSDPCAPAATPGLGDAGEDAGGIVDAGARDASAEDLSDGGASADGGGPGPTSALEGGGCSTTSGDPNCAFWFSPAVTLIPLLARRRKRRPRPTRASHNLRR